MFHHRKPLRYIRHDNHPPADLPTVAYDQILRALVAEAHRVQKNVYKSGKGSVYVGLTGLVLMAYHLSSSNLSGLEPHELLGFTDTQLARALTLIPTSLSNPSSGSHCSFLETAVGIATLVLIRTTATDSVDTFRDSWTSCAQVIQSAVTMAISEDRRQDQDDDGGCEVLYGRAGLLYSILRLRCASSYTSGHSASAIKELCSDETLRPLVQSIIRRGEYGAALYAKDPQAKSPVPPLMWTWHWKRYLGAAHGVAGILHIILLCPADIIRPYIGSILDTVEWLIGCQDANGNWPTAAPIVTSPARENDLVQWCHGAPGILLLLCTVLRCATSTSATTRLMGKLIASVQAGAALVYRHGVLTKGVGLCHGVAGSIFALLAVSDVLDRSPDIGKKIGDENNYYLHRAVHLAQLATNYQDFTERREMKVPDHPWSLYEGLAGMCCAWAEVLKRLEKHHVPFDRSGMPGFDDVQGDSWASW